MRVLLLTTAHTYRAEAFRSAAQKLSVHNVTAIDLPDALAAPPGTLTLDFRDTHAATQKIVAYAQDHPLDAILSVDDSASLIAAEASKALGLPHNSPHAVEAARDKFVMRTRLKIGGVRVPYFQLYNTTVDVSALAPQV